MKVKELICNLDLEKHARRDLKIAAAVKRAIEWDFGECLKVCGDKTHPDLCEIYVREQLAELDPASQNDERNIWELVGLTSAKTFKIADMKRELYGLEMFLFGKFGVRKQFNALLLALD